MLAAVVVLLSGVPAWACPRCAAGEAARLAVLTDGFARNLAITVLPFSIIAAVSALSYAVGKAPKAARRQRPVTRRACREAVTGELSS